MTVANAITGFRALMIPFFLYSLLADLKSLAVLLFSSFVVLDSVDGFIARALKQETVFGKNFDILTDFTFGTAALFGFIFTGELPLFLFAILLFVGIIKGVLIWLSIRKDGEIKRSRLGKVGILVYVTTFILLMSWSIVLVYAAAVVFAFSTLFYYFELRNANIV